MSIRYETLKVPELKALLKNRGEPITGLKKAGLIAALYAYDTDGMEVGVTKTSAEQVSDRFIKAAESGGMIEIEDSPVKIKTTQESVQTQESVPEYYGMLSTSATTTAASSSSSSSSRNTLLADMAAKRAAKNLSKPKPKPKAPNPKPHFRPNEVIDLLDDDDEFPYSSPSTQDLMSTYSSQAHSPPPIYSSQTKLTFSSTYSSQVPQSHSSTSIPNLPLSYTSNLSYPKKRKNDTASSDKWTCTACTYSNKAKRTVCKICSSAAPPPLPAPPSTTFNDLNAIQRTAATKMLDSHSNVFLTGVAGTGKSFVVNFVKEEIRERMGFHEFDNSVHTVAPTGIAADNVGGTTMHSFAGWFKSPGKDYDPSEASNKAIQRMRCCQILFVDEVSMVDVLMFEAIDKLAQFSKRNDRPFGGIKIILCGDFFQLLPVTGHPCIFSPLWEEAGMCVVELEEVVRQKDKMFVNLLKLVRLGNVSDAQLHSSLSKCFLKNKPLPPRNEIQPSMLYCMNRSVDAENLQRLHELSGETRLFNASDEYDIKVDYKSDARDKLSEQMNPRLAKTLQLKVNAQVLLTVNKPDEGLVNGSRGVVMGFGDAGEPMVMWGNGETTSVEKVSLDKQMTNNNNIKRTQYPLRLAWALTIHKSQGQTISSCMLDISTTFAPGQGYVALSRVSSPEGLWIKGSISSKNCFANKKVGEYFKVEVNAPPRLYNPPLPPSSPPRAARPPPKPLTPNQRQRMEEQKEEARRRREAKAAAQQAEVIEID